ncbi:hypothetical protein GXW78_12900 [Roseomonas terrae]|uniref:Uncharacterized protein n=1 Tax=Neoroseomonas terrae TaxID=424799 RepID=A0ABS5EHV6_9PROT|nr:hypothetical protein [Neoroseomonas terrae]MBR0650566.1 hypothetical protein [Neoroseomonas terrae]
MMNKPKTRTALAALCGVLIAGPALAQACLRPEERSAIEIRALRSYLMVAALQCRTGQSYNAPEGYNNFLRRFGSDLSAADRVAASHFQRSYGGAARGGRLDQYNTNLANEHSQDALRSGAFFCRDAQPLFQVVVQTAVADLPRLVNERNIIEGYDAPDCGTAAAATRRPAARRASARR